MVLFWQNLLQGAGPAAGATTITAAWKGRLVDAVGQCSTCDAPDGIRDGTVLVTVSAAKTLTALVLQETGPGSGTWDTYSSDNSWPLGVSTALGSTLLNNTSGKTVSVAVPAGGSLYCYGGDDAANTYFQTGFGFLVTASFSDGTSATATFIISGLGGRLISNAQCLAPCVVV